MIGAFHPFSGIDEGAKAIHDFTGVAAEFKSVIAAMPDELSWRIEIMLCDIEERDTMVQFRESLQDISQSSVSLAESVSTLPEDVKGVVEHAFDELEAGQEPLQQTLSDTRAAMAELNASLEQAERVAVAFQGTIDSAAVAGEAWQGVGAAFGLDKEKEEPAEPVPPGEEGPSFAEEWGSAADSITTAALELRGMVADVRALAEGSEGGALVEAATASTRSTIDHATLRAVQLVLVLLASAVAYQLLMVRLRRKSP